MLVDWRGEIGSKVVAAYRSGAKLVDVTVAFAPAVGVVGRRTLFACPEYLVAPVSGWPADDWRDLIAACSTKLHARA